MILMERRFSVLAEVTHWTRIIVFRGERGTQEMPDDGEYRNATKNLEECGFTVDYILTHTAPADTVEYMSRLNLGIKNLLLRNFH